MSDMPPEQMNEILDCIYSGKKIEAIKRYRELRGTGLKEAKQFVEQLSTELRETSPEKFKTPPTVGCASILIFMLVALAVSMA